MIRSLAWLISRRWTTILIAFTFLGFVLFKQRDEITASTTYAYYTRPQSDLLQQQGKFWHLFRDDLENYRPLALPLKHPEGRNLAIGFNASLSRKRPDFLAMTVKQWQALGTAHTDFVEKIRARDYRLPFSPGSRGIVTTAGGSHLPIALVSIRMLRETGSMLPVEVFLGTWSEWDPVICSKIMPSLNAKCVVLQDIFDLDKRTRRNRLSKYQYKIMSILFSSFEEVLFLDSDCFPIRRVNDLFEAEPFKSTGLVLWPDFWFPSESPLFFEIAQLQAPALNEHASTESGEILYSKSIHELSLLLATYYNYHGPDFYYPLQSQGAPGEGDKETFLWSAVAVDLPHYRVKHRVHALGYHTKDGDWRGSAMAQFDPVQDSAPDQAEKDAASLANQTYPRPYFAHVNFPKLNPSDIFNKEIDEISGPTKDSDGTLRRIWHQSEEDAVVFFGFDLERMVWKTVRDVACDYEGQIQSWKGKRDVCKKATEYWNAVFA